MSRPQDSAATYSHDHGGGCGCFRRFCFGWDEGGYLLQGEEAWPRPQLKQLSAGPKWKNLIRKIGRLFHHKKQHTPFQYSPESYALNFAADHHHQHTFSAPHQ